MGDDPNMTGQNNLLAAIQTLQTLVNQYVQNNPNDLTITALQQAMQAVVNASSGPGLAIGQLESELATCQAQLATAQGQATQAQQAQAAAPPAGSVSPATAAFAGVGGVAVGGAIGYLLWGLRVVK